LLHLLDAASGAVLLSVLDRVVLLRHLETKSRVANDDGPANDGSHKHKDSRSLVLLMHVVVRIGHFVVHVLVLVAYAVVVVGVHVVKDGQVIVLESSAIQVLRQVVESNVIPVGWVYLVDGQLLVLKGGGQRESLQLRIEHGHFTLEEFVLASVIICILVGHSESCCEESGLGNNKIIVSPESHV
jgi:hypothetical protein